MTKIILDRAGDPFWTGLFLGMAIVFFLMPAIAWLGKNIN